MYIPALGTIVGECFTPALCTNVGTCSHAFPGLIVIRMISGTGLVWGTKLNELTSVLNKQCEEQCFMMVRGLHVPFLQGHLNRDTEEK